MRQAVAVWKVMPAMRRQSLNKRHYFAEKAMAESYPPLPASL
jgi:hypothetical protein